MIKYFVIFFTIGWIVGLGVKRKDIALMIVVVLSVLSGLSNPMYGLSNMGEMLLGYFCYQLYKEYKG